MKITEEKLTYLLFLYKQNNSGESISSMAYKLGVTKSTLSRVISAFYQEGWTEYKGKGALSSQGRCVAKRWKQQIESIEQWLCGLGNTQKQRCEQEAITLAVNLSDIMRDRIIASSHIEQMFHHLSDIKQINGDVLGVYLKDGVYPFAFTIYKDDIYTHGISMANDAFIHPSQLYMEKGKGHLSFMSCEVEHVLMDGKVVINDRPCSMRYLVHETYHDIYAHQFEFRMPIDFILFHISKQERMMQASIPICIKTNHNCHAIAEKKAILQIICK